MTAATFAAGVTARHRVRRLAPPARRPVFARLRRPAVTRPAPAVPAVVPRAPQLRLVLAPRVAVSVTNHAAPAAGPPSPPVLRMADARIASRQIERLTERALTLLVRREVMPAPATAAFGHRAGAVPAPLPVAPEPMVPARPPAPVAAPVAEAGPATRPAVPAGAPPVALPAAPDIERLTDRVLASIDRRFVAERERRGRT